MKHHRIERSWMCVAAVALAVGCIGPDSGRTLAGPSPEGGGQISFALAGDYVPGGTNFKIRLYKTVPASLANKAYFESPCTGPNQGFTVTDLDIGDGYVVVYDGYSTATCDAGTLVARGIRGDVEVTKGGTGNAVYFIQVNEIGAISAFPVPGADLKDSGLTCTTELECQGTTDCADPAKCQFPFKTECAADEECPDGTKWVQYRVHPAARCVGGICRLKTLSPLNLRSDRAFHVLASGPGGDVAMVGGFTQSGGTGLTVGESSESETFGASSSLFRDLDLGTALGNAVGLMGATLLDGRRLVLVGGASAVGVEKEGEATVPVPKPQTCAGNCPTTLSSAAFVVDLSAGTATRSTLSIQGVALRSAMALVETIAGDAGPEAFVRTGLVQTASDRIEAGRASYRCPTDADGALGCVEVPGSADSTPRYAAASACLVPNEVGCIEVVVLGGNSEANSPFGELFSKSSNQIRNLTPTVGVPATQFGAVAVVAGGQIWTFGGTSDPEDRTPDMEPLAFNIDPENGTIAAGKSGLSAPELNLLLRTYHQATPLADGKSVLITGGLGPDRRPLSSAVLVEASGGRLTVKSTVGGMAQPRVAHRALRIQGGLMDGAILISGGLSDVKGASKYAEGAEIFLP